MLYGFKDSGILGYGKGKEYKSPNPLFKKNITNYYLTEMVRNYSEIFH